MKCACPRSRRFLWSHLGLAGRVPLDAHVYACLQHSKKLHASFDTTLLALLQADPDGVVLMLEGAKTHLPRLERALRAERADRGTVLISMICPCYCLYRVCVGVGGCVSACVCVWVWAGVCPRACVYVLVGVCVCVCEVLNTMPLIQQIEPRALLMTTWTASSTG